MSDRDRIAAIISTHDCFDYGGRVECRCGDKHEELPLFESVQAWGRHVADAVIRELGLREETMREVTYHPQARVLMDNGYMVTDPRTGEPITQTRYVTEWTTDE